MKNLPIVAKGAINIILYVVYLLLGSIIFSILFPLVMQVLGQEVLHPSNPVFAKIQYFIAILILLISLILRKHFYISLKDEEIVEIKTEKLSYTAKKKVNKKTKEEVKEDEEMKIYVDKEIK